MKKTDHSIVTLILVTGISSVVTELLTIREFLAQFSGNEFIITLIFSNWLVLLGIGTLLARRQAMKEKYHPAPHVLAILSFTLSCLPVLQFLFIRFFKDWFFIHGSSAGFYPVFWFSMATMAPYCLILGFVLPYSFFIMRIENQLRSGTAVYIIDNIGDISGGLLFSCVLIFMASPMQSFFICGALFILVTIYFSNDWSVSKTTWIMSAMLSFAVLLSGIYLEKLSLMPREGLLESNKESRYGRVAVYKNVDEYTFFNDGMPVASSQNVMLAEEIVHFPLSQVKRAEKILVISGQGGIMKEISKYSPQTVYYLEIDPDVSENMFHYGMMTPISGLQIINQDARKWLSETPLQFNAVIMNMPEPDTFQINRFYTDAFFREVRAHLYEDGIFSFYISGYDNYITEPQREKISVIYRTLSGVFDHILILPSERLFFLSGNNPTDADIPERLHQKGIETAYINNYYYGNITPMRLKYLTDLIDREEDPNSDLSPRLMRIMYRQWFEKFDTSPTLFMVTITVLTLFYMKGLSKGEYVLFTSGLMAMGSEIVIIFIYQVFYGYIYFKIGIIVTLFLAGLLPGAVYGERIRNRGDTAHLLALTDGLIIVMLIIILTAIFILGDDLKDYFYLMFGFILSILCGFQFPLASRMKNNDNETIASAFSADLIGASLGPVLTSLIWIPWIGIYGAIACLLLIKLSSMIIAARDG